MKKKIKLKKKSKTYFFGSCVFSVLTYIGLKYCSTSDISVINMYAKYKAI